MLPKIHIILGFIFSALLLFFSPNIGGIGFILIFLSSFLIDVDHYLYYLFAKKDFNLRRAFNWFSQKRRRILNQNPKVREKYKEPIIIFHGVELWIIVFALIFLNKLFLFILVGILFHILLDLIEFSYYHIDLRIKLSVIYVLLTNKRKKNFKC